MFDIDKPWEPYVVTVVTKQLLHIEWDTTGNQMLLISTDGDCQMWTMKVLYYRFENAGLFKSRRHTLEFSQGLIMLHLQCLL